MVQHLKKLINSFYKNYLNKLTVITKTINSLQLMAKPTIKLATKPTALK